MYHPVHGFNKIVLTKNKLFNQENLFFLLPLFDTICPAVINLDEQGTLGRKILAMKIVVCGKGGCGKSTVAALVALKKGRALDPDMFQVKAVCDAIETW